MNRVSAYYRLFGLVLVLFGALVSLQLLDVNGFLTEFTRQETLITSSVLGGTGLLCLFILYRRFLYIMKAIKSLDEQVKRLVEGKISGKKGHTKKQFF